MPSNLAHIGARIQHRALTDARQETRNAPFHPLLPVIAHLPPGLIFNGVAMTVSRMLSA